MITPTIVEIVRKRTLVLLDKKRWTYSTLGQRLGYKERTIAGFCRGDEPSPNVARAILLTYPDIRHGLVCDVCGEFVLRNDGRMCIAQREPDDRVDRLVEMIDQTLAFIKSDEVKANIREGVASILSE
jgi:hypothetical protein